MKLQKLTFGALLHSYILVLAECFGGLLLPYMGDLILRGSRCSTGESYKPLPIQMSKMALLDVRANQRTNAELGMI
jgi:hypothetical protein